MSVNYMCMHVILTTSALTLKEALSALAELDLYWTAIK